MSINENSNVEVEISQPNNKKLVVSLAYAGLIYLPVYVAKELNLFKGVDVELIQANGDDEAVLQVMHSRVQEPDEEGKIHYSDIAICDPFSMAYKIAETKSDPYKDPEDAVIIGCMIDKPPVWIYRSYSLNKIDGTPLNKADGTAISFADIKDTLPNPPGVDKEVNYLNDIEFKKVKNLFCYPSPNTGFLFGIDLISKGLEKDRTSINITEMPFDPHICEEGTNKDLILTSNIVKIAYDNYLYNKQPGYELKLIYSYSTGNIDDKLRDFLFTGILANKEITLPQNDKIGKYKGDEIVAFLSGLKDAIEKIKKNNFLQEERDTIISFLKGQLGKYAHLDSLKNDDVALSEISNLILELSSEKDCNFYSDDLRIKESLYDKTLKKRKEIIKSQKELEYFEYVDPIWGYKINQAKLTLCQECEFTWTRFKFWFYSFRVAAYIRFTEKYYPEIYSNGIIVFLLAIFIIIFNYYRERNIVDQIVGCSGLAMVFILFLMTVFYRRRYKKDGKLRDSPKVLLTVISTLYISAIGGKLLSTYFVHKEEKNKQGDINIIAPNKMDTIRFKSTDTSKTIIFK